MHKYVDSHLPLGGIYALSPFLFIHFFFLIARKNIAKTWPRSGEKGDQNKTRLKKSPFALLIFFKKKKKKKKDEEEESKKESKKERKKERKEQKRKEKKKA